MRKHLSAAVFAVLLSTSAFAAEPRAASPAPAKPASSKPTEGQPLPAGWRWVTAEDGKFRAAFPSQPSVEHSTEDTEAGKAQTVTYSVTSEADGSFLAVAVTKFPDGTMAQALPSQVLEGARDGALANVNGKIVTDKSVMVDGPKGGKRFYPGRDYEATGAQGTRISTRVILVEDRLYQIIFVRTAEKNEPFKQLLPTFALQQ